MHPTAKCEIVVSVSDGEGGTFSGAEDWPFELDAGLLGVMLREAYLEPPAEDVAERHLAAMMAASELGSLRAARRRRKWMIGMGLGAGVLAGTTGLAAAGMLPAPLQGAVADLVSPLGWHIPGGDDAPADAPSLPTEAPSGESGRVPSGSGATDPQPGGDEPGVTAAGGTKPDHTPASGTRPDQGQGQGQGQGQQTGGGQERPKR